MIHSVFILLLVVQTAIFSVESNKINLVAKRNIDDNSTLAECDTCLAGMNLVHYILSENYWVEIYMIAAQQLCQSIPSESLRDTCLKYVNNYLNDTLKILATAVNPDYICKALQACTNNTNSLTNRNIGDSILCEECKFVYSRIQSIFTDHTETKQMKSSLKMICLLYASDESKCNKVLQEYIDYAITYFQHHRADQSCYMIENYRIDHFVFLLLVTKFPNKKNCVIFFFYF
ncbi:hypothetical protein MS3_00006639 [Schistosoma haematobium]|uniref:Saposin B-type domain-containing protein n=1 Tax=Schistosoma haematobium TaxID=6185 RepID=A0A922LHY4_SCHHA|nr:hypothetical protein MS3_00006639 [Schistosoma haematobium]KAH9585349.1 hypothetical protein MS3_00006639 [Schistosoma haematobium]